MARYIESSPCATSKLEKVSELASLLKRNGEDGFGLKDGEVLQVLNMMPKEVVELHLIVEDLTSRLSEERQNELLEAIKTYCNDEKFEEDDNDGEEMVEG